MRKRLKGISGITVGLIAAIIFITVVFPLTVSYIVNTTNRFRAKSYGIEYQEYKILEEKGISACYTQLPTGNYIIKVNNTLGKSVIINLMYVKYGNNIETISTMNLRIKERTIIPLNTPLEPSIIRLVSSSGAVINVPPCGQIVATTTSITTETATNTTTVSYTDIIQYIITERYPINVYWDEKQYPEGIAPREITINLGVTITMNLGYVLSYANGDILTLSSDNYQTILFINGTLTPRKEWFNEELRALLTFVGSDLKYAPSFVLDTGPGSMSLVSTDSGDYLAMLLAVNSSEYDPENNNGTDTYGFWRLVGNWFQYGSYLESKPFKVKKLILNTSYKFRAGNVSNVSPLKYILVNSGYNFLIVGLQTDDFDPLEYYNAKTFTYQGTIYINPKEPPVNLNSSKIIINFKVTEIRNNIDDDLTIRFDYVKLKLPNGTEVDWTAAYREYIKKFSIGFTYHYYRSVLMDQIVFTIPEKFLGISGGDDVYVWANASFIMGATKISDSSSSWVGYTYMPVKPIIDSWIAGQ